MRCKVMYAFFMSTLIVSIVLMILTYQSRAFWKPTKAPTLPSADAGEALIASAKFSWDASVSSVNSAGVTIYPSKDKYDGLTYDLIRSTDVLCRKDPNVLWPQYPKSESKRTTVLVSNSMTNKLDGMIQTFIFETTPSYESNVGFVFEDVVSLSVLDTVDKSAFVTFNGQSALNSNNFGTIASNFDGNGQNVYVNGAKIQFSGPMPFPETKPGAVSFGISGDWTHVYVFDRSLTDSEQADINSYLERQHAVEQTIYYTVNGIPTAQINTVLNHAVSTYECKFSGTGTFSYVGSLLGMKLNTETGVINGTPNRVGFGHVQVKFTSADGSVLVTALTVSVVDTKEFPNKNAYVIGTSIGLGVSVIMLIIVWMRCRNYGKSTGKKL